MDPEFEIIEMSPEAIQRNEQGLGYSVLHGFALNFVEGNPFRIVADKWKRFRNGTSIQDNRAQLERGLRVLLGSLGFTITDFHIKEGHYYYATQDDGYLNFRIRCRSHASYQTEHLASLGCDCIFQFHFSSLPVSSQIYLLYMDPKKHEFLLRLMEDLFSSFVPRIGNQDIRKGFVEREWKKNVLGDPYFSKYFLQFIPSKEW